MAIRLIAVGRATRDPLLQEAQAYLDRLARHLRVDVREISPARRGRAAHDTAAQLEAQAIFKQSRGCRLIALDTTGRNLTSRAFAAQLQRWLTGGDMAFVIGGATGLHHDVLAKADTVLSLGAMTLPHRLARLVLCEQLYRAAAILHNEPYHK